MGFLKTEVRELLVDECGHPVEKTDSLLKNFDDNAQIQVTLRVKEGTAKSGTLVFTVPDRVQRTVNVFSSTSQLFRPVPKNNAVPLEKEQYANSFFSKPLVLGIKNPNGDTVLAVLARAQPEDLDRLLDMLAEKISTTKSLQACLTQNNDGWTISHILAAYHPQYLEAVLKRLGKHVAKVANMQLSDGRNLVQVVAEHNPEYLDKVLSIIKTSQEQQTELTEGEIEACSTENDRGENVVHVLKRTNPQFLLALLERLGKHSVDLVLAQDYNGHIPAQNAPTKLDAPATYLLYAMTVDARTELLARYKITNQLSVSVRESESINEYLSGYNHFVELKSVQIIMDKQRTAKGNANFVAGLLQSMIDSTAKLRKDNVLFPQLLSRLNDHFQCVADTAERFSDGALDIFNLLMKAHHENKAYDIDYMIRGLVVILTEREYRIQGKDRSYEKAPNKPTNELFVGTPDKPGIFDIIDAHLEKNHVSDPTLKGIFEPYKRLREKNSATRTSEVSVSANKNGESSSVVVAQNPLIVLHENIVSMYLVGKQADKSAQEIVNWFPRFCREKAKQQDKPVDTKVLSGDLRLPGSGILSNSYLDTTRKELRKNVDSASKASAADIEGYKTFLTERSTASSATAEEKALINNELMKATANEVVTQPFANSQSSGSSLRGGFFGSTGRN